MSAVVDCLNDAYQRDPAAVQALLINRVPCNQALVEHPQIPVEGFPHGQEPPEFFMVGALGLVNGVLQALNQPLVAMQWSTPDPVTHRRKLLGFQEYTAPTPADTPPVEPPVANDEAV